MKRTRPVRFFGSLLVILVLAQPARGFETSDIVPGTGTIEYAFTPGDDAAGLIVRAIDGARSQILVQAFSFTHAGIAGALIRAERRGLDVQVIADPEQIDLIDHNVIPQLVEAGIPVFTDAEHAAAHNEGHGDRRRHQRTGPDHRQLQFHPRRPVPQRRESAGVSRKS